MSESEPARAEPVPAMQELTRVSDAEPPLMIAVKAEMTEQDGATGARAGGETQGHSRRCGELD